VVDALFYNFAPGEVARHIPKVWRTTTPEAAIAARQAGCVKALRRILGDHVDAPAFARATDLLLDAATSAPYEGRPMYAALRAIPTPDDVVARLFHAASLLREHRGDGHIAALMIEGVGGLEAHVLFALAMDMPAEEFGRITAQESRALGVHWNLFPVADVNSNPANPIIGTRAFGANPEQVGNLVAAYIRGRIYTVLKHPMLAGVKLWAAAHLLANGDLGSIILFGSFLGWAVFDRISLKRRTDPGAPPIPVGGIGNDVIAVAVGLVAYLALAFAFHPVVIGVPVMGV
jgi:hypothetical protein